MKEILESIILNMVDNKEEVTITEQCDDKKVTLEVRVAAQDMGKIISKQGKIAKAIRTVPPPPAAPAPPPPPVEYID